MRRLIIALTALLAVATPVVLTAAPAQAAYEGGDHRACVTQQEWQAAFRGMTRADITELFDTRGRLVDSFGGWYSRDLYVEYAGCPGFGGTLELNFDNYMHNAPGFRLWSKDHYRW